MDDEQKSIFAEVFTELIRYQWSLYPDIREFVLHSDVITDVMTEEEHVPDETDAHELIEAFDEALSEPYTHDEWMITYDYTSHIWHFSRGLKLQDILSECSDSLKKVKSEIRTEIQDLSPLAFETLLFEIFREVFTDFEPIVQPPTHDGGYEMRVLIKDPVTNTISTMLVQAKHQARGVSVAQVRELIGTLDVESNQHRDKNFRGLMVSILPATSAAKDAARVSKERIDFLAVDELAELMITHNVGWQETKLKHYMIHPTFWKDVNTHGQ